MPLVQKIGFLVLLAGSLGVMTFLTLGTRTAVARPLYKQVFLAKYGKTVKEAAAAKCNVCHDPKDKTIRNEYGKAVEEALGETKVKKEEKVKEALLKAADAKNAEDKTFGEILKEGHLPVPDKSTHDKKKDKKKTD